MRYRCAISAGIDTFCSAIWSAAAEDGNQLDAFIRQAKTLDGYCANVRNSFSGLFGEAD